jgi:hypothetical protein
LNSPFPLLSFTPPIPGIVSTGIIFAFIYMCTHFLHSIHPSTSFPHHFSPHTGASPPFWVGLVPLSCSLIL